MSLVSQAIKLYAWKSNNVRFLAVEGEADSRMFYIQLYNTSAPIDLTNSNVKFFASKPDSTSVYCDCTIVDDIQGIVQLVLPEQMTTVSGDVDCWIQVTSADGSDLRFEGMVLEVASCGLNASAESSDDMETLREASQKVDAFTTELRNARFGEDSLGEKIEKMDRKSASNSSRIDSLVASATEQDQNFANEVIDARTDSTGTTHSSLGEALRTTDALVRECKSDLVDQGLLVQTHSQKIATLEADSTNLKSDLNQLVTDGSIIVAEDNYSSAEATWVQGVINIDNGQNVDSTTRIRTGQIYAYEIKISPSNGAKFCCVFYNDGVFVSSETWQNTEKTYNLSNKNANSVRLVLAKSDNSTVDTSYSSNVELKVKHSTARSAMFRGDFETLGYTSVSQCVEDGYYTFTASTASGITDIPYNFKSNACVVHNYKHITTMGTSTTIQTIVSVLGKSITRYIRANGTISDWSNGDNAFIGTLEGLSITDVDDCKSNGYYTYTNVTSNTLKNIPTSFKNASGIIQVFGNITTMAKNTWFQMLTNSSGDTAFRFIREDGSKGNWMLSTKDKKYNFMWYALGDSITQGYYSDGAHSFAITENCWVKYASEIIGCNVTNYGIGGSGYMDNVHATDRKNAKEKVNDIDFANCDLVTLAYGVNDWKYGYTLGSMSDSVSGGASVIANMRYVIEKIISDNPYCKIIVVTPLNCRGYDFDYGSESTNYGLGYKMPENNKTLQEFFDGMKEVCDYYGIEMIDNTHNSVVNRKSIVNILKDGVHPSLEGHKALGHEMAKKINFD